jgi:hypothetical protein
LCVMPVTDPARPTPPSPTFAAAAACRQARNACRYRALSPLG